VVRNSKDIQRDSVTAMAAHVEGAGRGLTLENFLSSHMNKKVKKKNFFQFLIKHHAIKTREAGEV
jgi:hypothetical protein